jgi:hypothetical protein
VGKIRHKNHLIWRAFKGEKFKDNEISAAQEGNYSVFMEFISQINLFLSCANFSFKMIAKQNAAKYFKKRNKHKVKQ